jgi:hypothetical protein
VERPLGDPVFQYHPLARQELEQALTLKSNFESADEMRDCCGLSGEPSIAVTSDSLLFCRIL